jgi:hypothetical protein
MNNNLQGTNNDAICKKRRFLTEIEEVQARRGETTRA